MLETYEQASGQVLNQDKTSIFFSQNTPHEIRQNIIQIVGIRATRSLEKYLGLPTIVGRSKTKSFQNLLEKTTREFSIRNLNSFLW